MYVNEALKASKSSMQKAADFRQEMLYGKGSVKRESGEGPLKYVWGRGIVLTPNPVFNRFKVHFN